MRFAYHYKLRRADDFTSLNYERILPLLLIQILSQKDLAFQSRSHSNRFCSNPRFMGITNLIQVATICSFDISALVWVYRLTVNSQMSTRKTLDWLKYGLLSNSLIHQLISNLLASELFLSLWYSSAWISVNPLSSAVNKFSFFNRRYRQINTD